MAIAAAGGTNWQQIHALCCRCICSKLLDRTGGLVVWVDWLLGGLDGVGGVGGLLFRGRSCT